MKDGKDFGRADGMDHVPDEDDEDEVRRWIDRVFGP